MTPYLNLVSQLCALGEEQSRGQRLAGCMDVLVSLVEEDVLVTLAACMLLVEQPAGSFGGMGSHVQPLK